MHFDSCMFSVGSITELCIPINSFLILEGEEYKYRQILFHTPHVIEQIEGE